jgi:anti-anti-sigma regulatory factor
MDKKAKQHGSQIILTNIRPEIYEVFAITKLNRAVRHQRRRSGRAGRLLIVVEGRRIRREVR